MENEISCWRIKNKAGAGDRAQWFNDVKVQNIPTRYTKFS